MRFDAEEIRQDAEVSIENCENRFTCFCNIFFAFSRF